MSAPGPPGSAPARAAVEWSRPRWVRAGGRRVRYRAAGEGPPVVLVHGLGLSCDFWERNGPPLAAAGYRVLAPDLPGFGRTRGPPVVPVSAQAGATAAFADALGLGPAVYVGHSVSAQAVLQLAAGAPGRARGLVLAAPTGDPLRPRLLRQALAFVADGVREPPRLVPALGRDYLRAGFLRWLATWVAAARHDTPGAARRAQVPGLVVLGRRDPVVRAAWGRELARSLPGGRVVTIEAAHALVFTAAAAFNAEVIAFLHRLDAPAGGG